MLATIHRFFTPTSIGQDPDVITKRHFLITAFLLTFCITSFSMPTCYLIAYHSGVQICITILAYHLLLFALLRAGYSSEVAGNGFVLFTLIAFTWAVITSGGLTSAMVAWFICVKVSAFWFTNKRTGYLWAGLVFVVMLALFLLQIFGFRFLSEMNPTSQMYFSSAMHGLILVYYMVIIAVYETWQTEARKKIEEQRDFLNAQNAEILAQNEEIQQQAEELQVTLDLVHEQKQEIEHQKEQSDRLLHNILPEPIAKELKDYGFVRPKFYERATIVFVDIKGFTRIAAGMNPEQVVDNLNYCFSAFDKIVRKHRLEKIKTIGDAYMCVGGVPIADEDNPVRAICAALEMLQFIKDWKAKKARQGKDAWDVRIGIHTGAVVAGVVGTYKFVYDIWGDAVNTASRMESSGEPSRVNISGETYALVKDHYLCTYRGKVVAKHKGEMEMYFVEEALPAAPDALPS